MKHGMCRTREYSTWCNIKNRCYNKKATGYKYWGGSGIRMSKSWFDSFEQFFADMGKIPNGMTMERVDNSKDYSKDNCKWGTREEQNNNRRNSLRATYKGKKYSIQELVKILGIKYATIYKRIQQKRPLDEEVQYGGDRISPNAINNTR